MWVLESAHKALLARRFQESLQLANQALARISQRGRCPNGHGMPDNWAVERVISVIRNACAHAHVLTYGSFTGKELVVEDKQQISRLLFVSLRGPLDEQPTKFRFVGTTPDGFGELLERWAAVIPELDPLGDIRSGDDEPHLHLTENFWQRMFMWQGRPGERDLNPQYRRQSEGRSKRTV